MSHPGNMVNVLIDANQAYQTIDGFGVNINSKYWDAGKLIPLLELLVDDLGATLFRVDIWGKSNWVDPAGELGPQSLSAARLADIYRGEVFQKGWAMMRWLNGRGLQPYLAASGDVPPWMLAADGKTLVDFDSFAKMMASLVEWARQEEKLDFHLFGPLNETDLGSPEGPTLSPEGFVRCCERLLDELDARGLQDIKLVVAEQSSFNAAYLHALVQSSRLRGRIGAFGLHDYSDLPPAAYAQVASALQPLPEPRPPLWMTEYGDLEQTGEREWYVAWVMAARLFDHLEGGFRASLVWDAFDNYHDHDEAWTIYGLLRTGLRAFTPKKRYYAARQVFRFVPPGFVRVAGTCDSPDVRLLAFANPERSQVTVVGCNQSERPAWLNVKLTGFEQRVYTSKVVYHRTSQAENCHTIGRIPVSGGNWPFTGIDVELPPACIFTLTSLGASDSRL